MTGVQTCALPISAYDYANTITLSGLSGSLQNVTQIGNTTTLGITAAAFQLNLASAITVSQGQMAWNPFDLTVDVGVAHGLTLQLGQEQYIRVKAASDITIGQAVMFAGADGEHILAAPNDMSTTGYKSEWFIGIAPHSFVRNEFGYVTTFGRVSGLNTLAFTVGDILFANPLVVGGLTNVEPEAPYKNIYVAAVTKRAGGDGHLMVRPPIVPSLDNLNDVYIDGVTDGAVLSYITANTRWEDVTRSSITEPGFSKANAAFLQANTPSYTDRKSTRLNSSHIPLSRMPSSA